MSHSSFVGDLETRPLFDFHVKRKTKNHFFLILPGFPRVENSGDSSKITMEYCFSPFETASPLSGVVKALNIDVNLAFSEYEDVGKR